MISVRTLGGFSLWNGSVEVGPPRTRKARALLAYLALSGLATPRERLVEMFWPDDDPQAARNSLKTALHGVRRCFRDAGIDPDAVLQIDKINVRWIGGHDIDALTFSRLSEEDADDRGTALELYRGDFLPDDYDAWATIERERLAAKYERMLRASLGTDAQLAHRILERDPYDERAYVALIESEIRAGHHLVAAAVAQRARVAMMELGVAPSGRLAELLAIVPHAAPVARRLPFCGRDEELQTLNSALRGGNGVLAVVLGPAGIGKSALLERAVASSGTERRVLRLGGSASDVRAYGPWSALNEALADGGDDAPQHDDLAGSLLARIPDDSALIVDDAQYFNRESAALLERIGPILVERGCIVIVAARSEATAALRPMLARADAVLELDRLSLSSVEVAIAAGGGDEATARRLFARSEGHPLFLAQLFAAASEDRDAELPATFKHRIESRLAAKGEDAVAVACALALEPDADVDMLVGALRMEEERVLDAFDDLLAAGIVREGKRHAWAFDHDTTAEIAAQMLRAPRRHALHERFADELAGRSEPDVSLRRARHLLAAGKRVEGARAFFASSEEAIELHAMLAAIERAEAGIEAIDPVERSEENDVLRANLHISQARAALELTDWAAATKSASNAVRAAESARNDERLAYALHLRAGANHASWNIDAALVDYERAARLMDTPETMRQRAIVGHEISAARRIQGDLAGSIEEAERSFEIIRAKRHEDPRLADSLGVNLQMIKASALATAWRFDEAERCFAESAQDALQVGGACATHWHETRAFVNVVAERFDAARDECAAAERLLEEADRQRRSISHHGPMLGHARYHMHVLRATMALMQRAFDEVEPALAAAQEVHVFERAPVERRLLAMLRAETLLATGSTDRATLGRFLEAIPDVDAFVGLASFSMIPRLTHARLLVRLGDTRAPQMLEKAWESISADARRTPLRCDDAFARLAEAAAELGDSTLARRAHEAAAASRARRLELAAI